MASCHCGRRHCRHDRRLSRLGLYLTASDTLRHRRDRRAHSHRRARRPEHVASAAFVWPRPSAPCSWRRVEPPGQYRVLHRLLLPTRTHADRADPGEYVRAFGSHADFAHLPALAFFGHGGRADNHRCALSRRGSHTLVASKALPVPSGSASTRRTKQIFDWCGMPSTFSRPQLAARRHDWCSRSCCASARCRPRPR